MDDNIVKYISRAISIIIIGVFVALGVMMCSCTRTVYVPVKEIETVYQNHTDTVHRTDSIIKEKETIVMQLDSQAMAHYGIKLSNAEKAWLVREKELENKINKLLEKKADTLIVRDSIPIPYPVEKSLSWSEKAWMNVGQFGTILLTMVLTVVLGYLFRKKFLGF